MELISLSFLVEEVVSEFITQDPGLKASFEIENNVTVVGNYSILKMVVRNLIASAIKCTVNLHNPTIVFGQIEDENVYFIMDNGKGFDVSDNQPDSDLFRKEPECNPNELSMRRILIKHGGKVWGMDKEDMGAVFYFSMN